MADTYVNTPSGPVLVDSSAAPEGTPIVTMPEPIAMPMITALPENQNPVVFESLQIQSQNAPKPAAQPFVAAPGSAQTIVGPVMPEVAMLPPVAAPAIPALPEPADLTVYTPETLAAAADWTFPGLNVESLQIVPQTNAAGQANRFEVTDPKTGDIRVAYFSDLGEVGTTSAAPVKVIKPLKVEQSLAINAIKPPSAAAPGESTVEGLKPAVVSASALPATYKSLGPLARSGMPPKMIADAAVSYLSPIDPAMGPTGKADAYMSTGTTLASDAAKIQMQADAMTDPAQAAQKAELEATAQGLQAASVMAISQANTLNTFASTVQGQQIAAAAKGDASAFGVSDKLLMAAGPQVQNVLASVAATAGSDPTVQAAAVRNAQVQLTAMDKEMKSMRVSNGVTIKNGYGEVVGYDMTTLLSASALGLGLYQALYAAPNEAKKQREFQLKLMDMQFQYQKELQAESLSTSKEIAEIQAAAQVASAEAGNEHGTPSSVNPGVTL